MSSRPKNSASIVDCEVPIAAMFPAYDGYGGARNQRRPRRIRSRIRIAVFIGTTNRSHRPPQTVLKLAGERGLQRVVQRDVCQRKQSRFFDCR